MAKSKTWLWLVLCLFFFLPGQAMAQSSVGFSDHKGHWAENTIQEFVDMDITQGYPDGTFRPNGLITRAEFLTLVVKTFDLPIGNSAVTFPDVQSSDWFYAVAGAAKAAGIVQGDERGNFSPHRPVSRAEMVTMVRRAAGESLVLSGQRRSFPDVPVGSWMEEPIVHAVQAGLVSGYQDGLFYPQQQATRAEAATVLIKTLDNLESPHFLSDQKELLDVVFAFENAGIEEINRQDYSLLQSVRHTVGLARQTTLFQGQELKKQAESTQARFLIDPIKQEAKVLEQSTLTAKVLYSYSYGITLQGPGFEESGTITEEVYYYLRKQNGDWKIYKMEESS
ncbi:S-layer homology domain-containing protein [Heliorestis convoluta]|uniref:SLH domain-containing protein n=1 Tax=Heliorestis convoluta TaxID=356322 RepID=A0A5Q2N9G9_9FIRM|nr:S-layer homology domain-containing protein [Heliorestis convoluta]QGG49145.1 hypothetical protein FTV88_3070 [Heliorestis convoluta]